MKLRILSAVSLAALLSACDSRSSLDPQKQTGPNPELPKAQNFFMPPMQVPEGTPWKTGETPKVADGLKIERIPAKLMHPRQLYVLPNGDVLVAEANGVKNPVTAPKQLIMGIVQKSSGKGAPGGNRISLLRNVNGKWEQHLFIENLNAPFGMQLIGNTLYVANADSLVKFPYQTGQTEIRTAPEEVTALPGGELNHHWTKALLASPDGSKLYVGVGSNSNITENGLGAEYQRAAVWEVDAASGASRIYASGIRNPTGLQWEPQSGKLWAIANERDEIGSDLVPDYMTSVQDNGFYGWPWSYFGQHVDDRVRPQRPDMVAKAIKPDYALSSHVAPLGLLFYGADNMPQYRGGAFISEHGSWNRTPLNGYKVVWVKFENGMPVGKPQPVVTGFLTDDEKKVRGLPVGLATDNQGGVLIADDAGDAIWRISAAQ